MNHPANTAQAVEATTLMLLARDITLMIGALTWSEELSAQVTLPSLGTNSRSAAKQRDNARCVMETAAPLTLKLVRLKELTIGVSGESMIRTHAPLSTMVRSTQLDLLMSACAASIRATPSD